MIVESVNKEWEGETKKYFFIRGGGIHKAYPGGRRHFIREVEE